MYRAKAGAKDGGCDEFAGFPDQSLTYDEYGTEWEEAYCSVCPKSVVTYKG
jgi:hypothetical protein